MDDKLKKGLRIEVDNDLFMSGGEPMPLENLQIQAEVDDDEEFNSETDDINLVNVSRDDLNLPEPPANIRITFSQETKMKEDGEISGDESSSIKDIEIGGSDAEKFQKTSEESMELDDIFNSQRDSQRSDGSQRTDYSNRENIRNARTYENPFLGSPEVDQNKLNLRALRFGTRASTPTVDEFPSIPDIPDGDSEAALLGLYLKVGLLVDDGAPPSLDKVGPQHRTDAILIRGTNDMSTKDIFAYLAKFRHRPIKLEWVNDACCVVVFKDKFEAGKCLLMMTKPIIVAEKKMNPSLPTLEELDENSDKTDVPMVQEFDYDKVEAVPEKMITVPMPPGSIWRFAIPCEKAKGIIMRIAVNSDKKQDRAEKYSEYYKRHGNPNRGPRKNLKRSRVEDEEEEDSSGWNVANLPKIPISNKSAWSELSADWQAEELGIKKKKTLKARRRSNDSPRSYGSSSPGSKNLKVMVNFAGSIEPREGDLSAPVQSRLKRKRDESSDDEDFSMSKMKEPEDKNVDSSDNEEDNFWTQRLKGPLMRMHADEEEQKIEREKMISSRYESKNIRRPMSQRLGSRNNRWMSRSPSGSLESSSRSNVKDLREVIKKRASQNDVDDGMDSDPDPYCYKFI